MEICLNVTNAVLLSVLIVLQQKNYYQDIAMFAISHNNTICRACKVEMIKNNGL